MSASRSPETRATISEITVRTPPEGGIAESWARQQGHSINDRGRIPVSIQRAFGQAHQGSQLAAVG